MDQFFVQDSWVFIVVFSLFMVWSLVWKALALWKSARRENKVWFIVFMLVNTLGLLEILYLYVFSKKDKNGKE